MPVGAVRMARVAGTGMIVAGVTIAGMVVAGMIVAGMGMPVPGMVVLIVCRHGWRP